MKLIGLVTFVLLVKLLITTAHYNRAFIEDLCRSDEVVIWNLGSGSANSSGILRTSRKEKFLMGKNCTIVIQPPLGYGVVLSIRRLDFRPYYLPECGSFVEVWDESKSIKLCGYSDDLVEYQSYFSEGRPMKLNFKTVNESGIQYHSEVYFIATSYVKLPYGCEMKMFQCENSRCIWKDLTCDGHNNCGDRSDEFSRGRANCGAMPPGIIAAIVVGSVMAFILLIIIPFACCRCYSKRQNTPIDPPLIQPDTTYRSNAAAENAHQSGDYQQPSSSDGGYRDLPPAYKP